MRHPLLTGGVGRNASMPDSECSIIGGYTECRQACRRRMFLPHLSVCPEMRIDTSLLRDGRQFDPGLRSPGDHRRLNHLHGYKGVTGRALRGPSSGHCLEERLMLRDVDRITLDRKLLGPLPIVPTLPTAQAAAVEIEHCPAASPTISYSWRSGICR